MQRLKKWGFNNNHSLQNVQCAAILDQPIHPVTESFRPSLTLIIMGINLIFPPAGTGVKLWRMAPVTPPTSSDEHCQCVSSKIRLNFDLSTQPLACWPSHPTSNEHLQVSMRVFKEDSIHPKRGAGSKTPPPTVCTLSLSLYLYLTTRRGQELAWKPLRPLTIRHCTDYPPQHCTAPSATFASSLGAAAAKRGNRTLGCEIVGDIWWTSLFWFLSRAF